MSEVDLRRSAPARLVDDIDQGAQPGEVQRDAHGYLYCCPGCRALLLLPVRPLRADGWDLTAGDLARPESVTLSPSIHHATERGGCGWHGYLTAGAFRPC